jgi:hypothetical protein
MAQTYTLEEASGKLGLTVEEMKRRLKEEWKALRSFRDGATVRFRAPEIDELARSLGRGSDPELQISPGAGGDAPLAMEDSDILDLSAPPTKSPDSARRKPPSDSPLVLDSGDFFTLADEDVVISKPSSGTRPRSPSDSDVRLDVEGPKSGIRPGSKPTSKPGSKSPRPAPPPADDISDSDEVLSMSPPPAPKSGPKHPAAPKTPLPPSRPVEGSSDYELKLDSSSDFELKIDESDEEVSLGEMPKGVDRGGDSGINLKDPADSGISLEKSSDSEIDFELSLDPTGSGPSSSRVSKSKSNVPIPPSDSEFELTLDDAGELAPLEEQAAEQKDIFETDFEIPALDDESASEAVPLEDGDTDLESSDFDLAGADVVEDEDVADVAEDDEAPRRRRKAAVGEDDEHFGDMTAEEDEEEEGAAAPAMVAAPAAWGPVPAILMIPCVLVMFLVGVMGYELVHGMWGYTKPSTPSSLVVRTIAGMFDDNIKKD